MLIEDILKLPIDEQFKELKRKPTFFDQKISAEDVTGQYETAEHKVFKAEKRPDKIVATDNAGGTKIVPVARLGIPFQKIIARRTASLLAGNGITLESNAQSDQELTVVQMIKSMLSDAKTTYANRKLLRVLFSEREVAELWYFAEEPSFWQKVKAKIGLANAKFKMKMKLLYNSMGDTLYPHFDEFGDMDAFSREYSVTVTAGKLEQRFDVYTATATIKYTKAGDNWIITSAIPNPIGKIPVIYYAQAYTEWHDVQALIERYETVLSNFSDTNDYFAAPQLILKGEVNGLSDKSQSGKVITLEASSDADAKYLTWAQAPEAIKLELDTLEANIFSGTQTPNISFEKMKALGTNLSGVAIEMLFMDAHLKCLDKQEIVGEGIQRRFNLLKAAIGNVIQTSLLTACETVDVTPVFNIYSPKNKVEDATILMTLSGNKPLMSQKTGVENSPYTADSETELAQIQDEAKAESQALLTGSFNA